MEKVYEHLAKEIIDAQKQLNTAKNLLNKALPIMNEPKILIAILESLNDATKKTISGILQYEYLKNNIQLTKNPEKNTEIFFSVCAKKYNLSKNEKDILISILLLGKKRKKSNLELPRPNKMVLIGDDFGTTTITKEKLSPAVEVVSSLIQKVSKNFQK